MWGSFLMKRGLKIVEKASNIQLTVSVINYWKSRPEESTDYEVRLVARFDFIITTSVIQTKSVKHEI